MSITTPDSRAGDLASQLARLQTRNGLLRAENTRLRALNDELRAANRQLQAALDVHRARAQSAGLFGPLEMTAGTSVGPLRRRH